MSDSTMVLVADSTQMLVADSAVVLVTDSAQAAKIDSLASRIGAMLKPPFKPDPTRALWLSLVLPGAGQIYNHKYWKLPIVYGGFIGCLYAMSWNNTMYKDYSQAYIDLMDKDPNTQSYNQFLHLGTQITPQNEERYKDIFRKRKDKFRRWRDLSFFVMLGVYALSVIDAYVDAELSVFDISDDLSLKVEPAIINNHSSSHPFEASSLGLQCSLNF